MDSGPLIPVNGQVLREVQLDHPIEFNRQLGPSPYLTLPGQDSALREYLRVLIKRKWLVVSCVVIIFGVVALATMRSTRIYDAFGSIAINKTDPDDTKSEGSSGTAAPRNTTIPPISTPKSEFLKATCWPCR